MRCEAVLRRGEALSKAVRDVIGAKQAHKDVYQMEWHERKDSPRGRRQGIALEMHKGPVAARKR